MVLCVIYTQDGRYACLSSHHSVFDVLTIRCGVQTEEAIEADSWCDLATVGEIYEGSDFRIVIEED